MKKFFTIILALFMTCSMALLTNCKDNSTEEVITRLEKKSYEVNIDDEEWIEE